MILTAWKISTDSGEIEWRNREDEAFERAILDAARVRLGLSNVIAN